ncbi:neuropeptide CCHamide-2-like isoform X1 [Uranotaenia lowii]|uniref:neuropeptide CCHamide-2-like isoform X1 n=2 Tax=Uranotaenia lowii TaxID=190385 RepID=UPI00247A2C43|nr:neuropeptide CCHamide-2-like isoform X1 [Uranotaenia lowii]
MYSSRDSPKMPHLSAICLSLVVVSVLVQDANAKRGCAAFGHACYGGHGKRSSLPLPAGGLALIGGEIEAGGGSSNDSPVPPLPYLKLMERSKSLDLAPELRTLADDGMLDNGLIIREEPVPSYNGHEQFEQGMRFAMNAILRQLIGEKRQRQRLDLIPNYQPSEPAMSSQLIESETK